MLIKFFKNGQGRGAGPVGYLIAREVVAYSENRDALRDASGRTVMVVRDPLPEVLRGNAALIEAEIDACPHQWTYRSGVLSFTREDAPTERQQVEVMDAFERLAFAGLERDQWDILWVRHTHEDRVELHFVTPRMELSSGRSLNIAPPGYQKAFDALRDVENKRHGWADPEDPARARDVVSLVELARRGQAREVIHDWLLDRITEGKVQDRSSMVAALTEAGFQVPRAGKDYITALDAETNERLRLRGDIFREDWTRAAAVERALERAGDRTGNGEQSQRGEGRRLAGLDADELQSRLRAFEQQRADYNRGRYGQPRAREPQGHERPDRDDARGPGPDPADDAYRPLADRNLADPADRHQLRAELVLGAGDDQRRGEERAPKRGDHLLPDPGGRDPARGPRQADPRDLSGSGPSGRLPDADDGPLGPSAARRQSQTPEGQNDRHRPQRVRATDWTGERIARLRRAVDDGVRGLGGAVRGLGETLDRADQRAAGRIGKLLQFATEVSDHVSRRLRQFGRRFERTRELAPGLEPDGRGSARSPSATEPRRDIGRPAPADAPGALCPTAAPTRTTRSPNRSADRSR
jgi:Relaxase/Mobilisation nuclease domain